MTIRYHCGVLIPCRNLAADAHNRGFLGPDTLGIEVTEPGLAAQCGLGNIDPQHGAARPSVDCHTPEAAIEECLRISVPSSGSILVTVRPDLDSIGAMALLNVRVSGFKVDAGVIARVREIGRLDRFDHGTWPGRVDLPTGPNDPAWNTWISNDMSILAACVADNTTSVGQRVEALTAWLRQGTLPDRYRTSIHNTRLELALSLQTGMTTLDLFCGGRAVVLRSQIPTALQLAYRVSPIVLAVSERPDQTLEQSARKVTIAQFAEGYMDLDKLRSKLSKIEPGWGGSPTIIGSPQDVGSRLSKSHLMALIEDSLASH